MRWLHWVHNCMLIVYLRFRTFSQWQYYEIRSKIKKWNCIALNWTSNDLEDSLKINVENVFKFRSIQSVHNVLVFCIKINLPLFSTIVPSNICMFLSCRPFVVITTLSTGLVGVEGLQDRNKNCLKERRLKIKVN